MMTKTDYEAIAKVIASSMAEIDRYQDGTTRVLARLRVIAVARGIAEHCAARDRQFKHDRFFAACGITHF